MIGGVPLDKLRLLDAVPNHGHFGITDARVVAAGDPFQFIQLPLGNSKRLGLVLDFGELGSAGDHALILNPRLVKN